MTPQHSRRGAGRARRSDTAVLFMTHRWSDAIGARFSRLRAELAGRADCFLLLEDDGGVVRRSWTRYLKITGATRRLFPYSARTLEELLGYPFCSPKGLVPGSAHYP